ncbi:MAG: hypothetical protein JW818_18325 [Pirellulales bacterium]|nr:hypothetical protein [Pirellulales bacterium]
MPSSTAVVARAIVMLACLITVPLVAMFWSSLPELVTKFLDGQSTQDSTFSRDCLSEAPKFYPGEETSPVVTNLPHADPHVVPTATGSLSRTEVPTGYNAPIVSANPVISDSALGPSARDDRQSGQTDVVRSDPALRGPPRNVPPQSLPAGLGQLAPTNSRSGSPSTAAASDGGTFVLIQERLRDMGAVYYRLESWGTQQQLFRFQCEMAVGGNQGLTRHFEANDRHPLLAMHKVLVEVEAWHASR